MEGLSARPAREASRIFQRISVLNDPVRCRILLLLEDHELAVSELCSVLQLPQSTVSRHLKTLADDDWIGARRDGTSRRYSGQPLPQEPGARRLWQLLRDEMEGTPAAAQDRTRLNEILARRRSRSQEFFSTVAEEWSDVRRTLFGERFDLEGLLGLLDEDLVVGDLGCGDGQTSQSLAPFVGGVIAVDESESMLAAARSRLSSAENVELRRGRLERLPIDDGALDAALLIMVLHHLPTPAEALTEAGRALRPGGKILLVDILPHEHEEYRQQMGHLWLGFARSQLERWLEAAGFHRFRHHELRADPEVKGPTLFAATARLAVHATTGN